VELATQAELDAGSPAGRAVSVDLNKISLGTRVTTTGGTSVTIATGLPEGIRYACIMFAGVSSSGTSQWLLRPGFGGITPTTGYTSLVSPVAGSIASQSSTAGFRLQDVAVAANSYTGVVELFKHGNSWICKVSLSSDQTYVGNGRYDSAGELSDITLTTDGALDTFDVVDINVQYMR
jgi:hypothetical protein